METLAIAVSENANQIAFAIRGELREEPVQGQPDAVVKLDETTNAKLFITPVCGGYVAGAKGAVDALEQAEAELVSRMTRFDYDQQTVNP